MALWLQPFLQILPGEHMEALLGDLPNKGAGELWGRGCPLLEDALSSGCGIKD